MGSIGVNDSPSSRGAQQLLLLAVGAMPWAVGFTFVHLPSPTINPFSQPSGVFLVVLAGIVIFVVLAYELMFAAVTERGVALTDQPHLDQMHIDRLLRVTDTSVTKCDQTSMRFERLTYLLDRFQSRINDEYSGVQARTGWLLTSQAFLLAALVTVMNAEQIGANQKYWITLTIGFAGSVFAFVLALALFHGHALIGRLKRHRDRLETEVHQLFGMPRAGVPERAFAHIFGHSATRFLPALVYVLWVAITIAIATKTLAALEPPSKGQLRSSAADERHRLAFDPVLSQGSDGDLSAIRKFASADVSNSASRGCSSRARCRHV